MTLMMLVQLARLELVNKLVVRSSSVYLAVNLIHVEHYVHVMNSVQVGSSVLILVVVHLAVESKTPRAVLLI